jgi:type II secretory pathway pseudopilin PulG
MSDDRRQRCTEDGDSLIETLVALAILGIILPTLFGLIFTQVVSVRVQRQSALDNQVMVSVAEAVKADPFAPTCPMYSMAAAAFPLGWSGTESQSCQTAATQPSSVYALQLVTLSVFAGPGQTGPSTSVVIVKSNR